MSKAEFARRVGITKPYLSMLLADDPPWPGRDICLAIARVSRGKIDPNKLAGWRRKK
jgi:DNA-binding transcriptional regulator YdaS (Cro superfamily)